MNLGNKITELRKQKGWSQSELAKKLQVSREIVGRYEGNDANPSIEIAKRMTDVLEVSLDYLVGGSTEQDMDKVTLNRCRRINRLSEENKKWCMPSWIRSSPKPNYRAYFKTKRHEESNP